MKYSKEELTQLLGFGSLEGEMLEESLGTFLSALDKRTAMAVADKLSDEQLDAFEKVVTEQGDDAAEQWLRQQVGDYELIEDQVCETLLAERQETSDSIE